MGIIFLILIYKIDLKRDNFSHLIKILLFKINHPQISIILIDNINTPNLNKIIKIMKIIHKLNLKIIIIIFKKLIIQLIYKINN